MSTADKSYISGFSIKFPPFLDNLSDIRQLDIFDSKLTVWEDYIVGIQLLITGKAREVHVLGKLFLFYNLFRKNPA